MRARGRPLVTRLLVEGALFVAVAATVLPILWLVVSSVRFNRDIISPGFAVDPTLENFTFLLGEDAPYLRQFVNSTVIVVGAMLASLLIGTPAGYSLSKLGWSRRSTVALLMAVALIQLVPPMTLIPGLFVVLANLGLLGSIAGLTLLNTVFNLPFATILMKVYFDSVPGELREAALVDGATELRSFIRIMLPLAAPGVGAVAILTAIFSWNEFLMGLTLTTGGTAAPITVGIGNLMQPYEILFGPMSAMGVVAAIPIIAIAVLANRYIVAGLTRGAVKG